MCLPACVCASAAISEMKFENVQRMRWKFGCILASICAMTRNVAVFCRLFSPSFSLPLLSLFLFRHAIFIYIFIYFGSQSEYGIRYAVTPAHTHAHQVEC